MRVIDGRVTRAGAKRLAQPLVLALALVCTLVLGGCASSSGGQSIDLMPAPEVFDNGAINPLPEQSPIKDLPYGGILYATDRTPAPAGSSEPYYSSDRGQVLRLGAAKIAVGDTTMTWEEARRISLLKNRPGNYPIKVTGVTEFGVLGSTRTPLQGPAPPETDLNAPGRTFAKAIDDKLATSRIKDVFIYVHGYKVGFENPILVASELWHFLGYQGVFIAYSWPATPKATAYMGDIDTAAGMARNLRELIVFIETSTTAEHVHVIGYSAGTRLVSRAVEQMALINRNAAPGAPRVGAKLENVILVGSDVDRAVFGSYLADGILDVPHRLTVYANANDKALRFSRFLTGHERVGTMWRAAELSPSLRRYFATEEDRLSVVNVTEASNADNGNGHAYFRSSPWVSSDILMTLAYRLKPEDRGLVRDPETSTLTFPPDYVARMNRALTARIGALTASPP
jgi:esterase/lipase superfamily enzyme